MRSLLFIRGGGGASSSEPGSLIFFPTPTPAPASASASASFSFSFHSPSGTADRAATTAATASGEVTVANVPARRAAVASALRPSTMLPLPESLSAMLLPLSPLAPLTPLTPLLLLLSLW
jgi:hypothetical protein